MTVIVGNGKKESVKNASKADKPKKGTKKEK